MKSILMIDDDLDDIEIVRETIKNIDPTIRFFAVTACEQAIQMVTLESLIPDFIFLDLNLPGMTGKECLAKLRNIAALEPTVIVIYTTSTNPSDKEVTRLLGATHFLNKPNTMKELSDALQSILNADKQNI